MSSVNKNFINFWCYEGSDGIIKNINVYYGEKWDSVKTDNACLNSIFKAVDDGDGVIQPEELNFLNRILLFIDSLKEKTANNEIIEKKELQDFQKLLEKNKISLEDFKKEEIVTQNWSEGLDRNIKRIQIADSTKYFDIDQIAKELEEIGAEQGFIVERTVTKNNLWMEDSVIRRHDGKYYLPLHSDPENNKSIDFKTELVSDRGNRNEKGTGAVLERGGAFDVSVEKSEVHYGKSYLEGGNVFTHYNSDGIPTAIVGENSIADTLDILGLENTSENVQKIKEIVATDLGLSVENITFIPEHIFHIDMFSHPLHKGEFAMPDYDEAVRILDDLIEKADKEKESLLSGPNDETRDLTPEQSFFDNQIRYKTMDKYTERKIKQLDEKIEKYNAMKQRVTNILNHARETLNEAEDILKNAGYNVIKIPCFSSTSNFMNGISGTSEKTGQSYFITNKSPISELNTVMEQYLNQAGIDKVYFISTQKALDYKGGIDCLTQAFPDEKI